MVQSLNNLSESKDSFKKIQLPAKTETLIDSFVNQNVYRTV